MRALSIKKDLMNSVAIIRKAFSTVANKFNITQINCPTNPAYITIQKLNLLKEKGTKLFGLYYYQEQIGFVAIERSRDDSDTYFMEKII